MIATQLELLPLPHLEKEENGYKIYLTPEEVKKVISCCQNRRDRLILRMLWRTGLRVSELLNLRAEDIDFENATLTVLSLKGSGGKRVIPIDRETLELIRSYLGGRRYGKVFQVGRRWVVKVCNRLGKACGIDRVGDPTQGRPHKLHPHTFRHSFAVRWIEVLGAERIVELQRHLGHKKLETTMRYLRFSPQALHQSYDRLWPVSKFA